jgi:hypothetical protein
MKKPSLEEPLPTKLLKPHFHPSLGFLPPATDNDDANSEEGKLTSTVIHSVRRNTVGSIG